MKRSSASLAVKQLQIKITMRNHNTLIRIAERKTGKVDRNVIILNADEDMKNWIFHTSLTHCGWEYKIVQTPWGK